MILKQYVVIVGTIFENREFYGPFFTDEEAEEWAYKQMFEKHIEIQEIRSPT